MYRNKNVPIQFNITIINKNRQSTVKIILKLTQIIFYRIFDINIKYILLNI